MTAETIHILLLSETTFASSIGSGDIDIDVARDELGLPYLPGTTLKRLLASSWKDMASRFADLGSAGREVFGLPGELTQTGMLDVGDGTIDPAARDWIAYGQATKVIDPTETLDLFTVERVQTAIDATTGAPAIGSLRRRRAVRWGTEFMATCQWLREPAAGHRQVLALAALATRHGGHGRTRGAGHLQMSLAGPDGRADRSGTCETAGVTR